MPATNTGFASGGVTCKLGSLCFFSSSVLADSFVLLNPPEHKARNRCGACIKKRPLPVEGKISITHEISYICIK